MSDFQYDEDVGRATGAGEVHEDFLSNLSRISQLTGKYLPGDCSDVFLIALTGFSDPIYAEAYVKIHGFDIMLGLSYYFHIVIPYKNIKRFTDVLLVNQTSNTLQNLCVDFATLGGLKIVERPTVYTVAPHGFQNIKATIKVSSTETGVIFGSILWDGPDLSEQAVILSDIHVDIMDYIKPTYCTEAQVLVVLSTFDLRR